jgi:hypothetical protein
MRLVTATVAGGLALALLGSVPEAAGQGRGGPGRGAGAAPTAREAAPADLTGYWVSIVTEDWIERMSPDSPPSGTGGGGFGGGRGGGAPAPASNDPCRAYGAAGSMRVPGRLHITWADDSTLQIEMDAGTQTRVLHFDGTVPPGTRKTLQGYSVAQWSTAAGGRGGRGGRGRGGRGGAPAGPAWGSLYVETTNLAGGYLLSTRQGYSENAVLREEFIPHSDFGVDYLTVKATVEDGPQTRVTSSTFRKEPDGSTFNPSACEAPSGA